LEHGRDLASAVLVAAVVAPRDDDLGRHQGVPFDPVVVFFPDRVVYLLELLGSVERYAKMLQTVRRSYPHRPAKPVQRPKPTLRANAAP